jgi:hypothetical protein
MANRYISPDSSRDDGPIGLQTAFKYAVLCFLAVTIAAAAYISYIQRQVQQQRAQTLLASELAELSQKSDAILDASRNIQVLQEQIAALPTFAGINKGPLLNTTGAIRDDLNRTQSSIDAIHRAILTYQRSTGQISLLSLITPALAQGSLNNPIPLNLKIDFAIAAFGIIVLLMVYCLWMIARPGVTQADKKWAKDLLNKQLVFLGGVFGGIILK